MRGAGDPQPATEPFFSSSCSGVLLQGCLGSPAGEGDSLLGSLFFFLLFLFFNKWKLSPQEEGIKK